MKELNIIIEDEIKSGKGKMKVDNNFIDVGVSKYFFIMKF